MVHKLVMLLFIVFFFSIGILGCGIFVLYVWVVDGVFGVMGDSTGGCFWQSVLIWS